VIGFLQPNPPPTPVPVFGAGLITSSFLLSVLVWVPVLMAVVVAVMPNPRRRYDSYLRLVAFWTNAGLFFLTAIAYNQFSLFLTTIQYEEKQPWLPALGVTYHLGVDGPGMALLVLSQLVGMIASLASAGVRERVREYFCLLLLTQAAANGVIVARDAFVLLLFWGAAVVPLALLVMGWGGAGRVAAGWRLLAYWGAGTVLLGLAVLLLFAASGAATFDLDYLQKALPSPRAQVAVSLLVLAAAATRLPLLPLHGWAAAAYAEAPVGVAVLIAGSASRLGGDLLLRLWVGAEHDGARLLAPFVAVLAGATIAYAGLAALRAADVRRLGAYLALVPGGVTVLGLAGLTALALDGAVLSLVTGGLAAALIVGACATAAERAQARSLELVSGVGTRAPRLAWLLVLAGLGLVGVPLFGSFVAQLMVLFGSLRTEPAGAFLAGLGLVVVAVAVAVLLQRVIFGAPNPDAPGVGDLGLAEAWYLGLLAGALLWFGLLPSGPKLAGVPIFDPGMVNVMNVGVSEIASPYLGSETGT